MKLSFETTCAEVSPPLRATAVAPTVLQCLAQLEHDIDFVTGTCGSLSGDSAFDIADCMAKLTNGEAYRRLCFSTPEENFEIRVA